MELGAWVLSPGCDGQGWKHLMTPVTGSNPKPLTIFFITTQEGTLMTEQEQPTESEGLCAITGTSCDLDTCPDHYCDCYRALAGLF